MTNQTELLERAIKLLNKYGENDSFIAEIKEALEQPTQEPVAWQASQADQAEYVKELEEDRSNLEYKCAERLHEIEQLQLDNDRLREALEAIDLNTIAKKVINDAINRFITQKPMYDSEDLMICLVRQAIKQALTTTGQEVQDD